MNNIITIKKEEINNQKLGNFLYEKNGELSFSNELGHCIFEFQGNGDSFGPLSPSIEKYIENFLGICANLNNKPSLMFINYLPRNFVEILNGIKGNYKLNYNAFDLETTEQFKIFNQKPCITYVRGHYLETLKQLVETRSENPPQNDVFVFFNEPETFHRLRDYPGLDTIVSVSKSRKIYFIFNFADPSSFVEKYGQEMYDTIKNNCSTKFIYNNNGIVSIQA